MRRRNEINLDAHKTTRKSKVNVELVAQLHQYAAACKLAKAQGTARPHISQYVK